MLFRSTLATGDFISFSAIDTEGNPAVPGGYGLSASHTFAGSVYFERMKALGLYTTDKQAIRKRVRQAGMEGVFST